MEVGMVLMGLFFLICVLAFFACLACGVARLLVWLYHAANTFTAPYLPSGAAGRQIRICWLGLLASGTLIALDATGHEVAKWGGALTAAAILFHFYRPQRTSVASGPKGPA